MIGFNSGEQGQDKPPPNGIWSDMIFDFSDALADTFYSVGFVMSLCQLLSILELFHIADGIEKARLLPRFVQVCTAAQPYWRISLSNILAKVCIHLMRLIASMPFVSQVTEKNLLLIVVIMLEDMQSKPVVCVQFFLWNILDLLRCDLQLFME